MLKVSWDSFSLGFVPPTNFEVNFDEVSPRPAFSLEWAQLEVPNMILFPTQRNLRGNSSRSGHQTVRAIRNQSFG